MIFFKAGGSRKRNIVIGAFQYVINFKEHIVYGGDALYGQHNPADLILTIDSKTSPQRQAATVLHEVIHAINAQSNLDLSEEQVDVLSHQWLSVMRDNPKLITDMMAVLA